MVPAQPVDPIPGGCGRVGPNLVLNPEFDLGNTQFSSDYQYNPGFICEFGQYTVAAGVVVDPNVVCYSAPTFSLKTIWAVTDRKEPGIGNFMIIDPSEATGAADDVWRQVIPVCPGAQYTFSVFAKNVYFSEAPNYSGVDPNFEMEINGDTISGYYVDGVLSPTSAYQLTRQPVADSAIWTQISGSWTAGVGESSATVVIRNLITGAQGNDLAIDGVFFGICGQDVGVTVTGAPGQCPDDGPLSPVTLSPSPETLTSGWLYYEWVKDGNAIAGDATPQPLVVQPQPDGSHFGIYQLKTYNTPTPVQGADCGFASAATVLFNSCENTFPVAWGPVEATVVEDRAVLTWSTLSELQNRGFAVEYAPAGQAFRTIGFVDGAGTTQELQQYRFESGGLRPGAYHFRLRQVDYDGAFDYSPVVEVEIVPPRPFMVNLAPNPAQGMTRLFLDVQEEQPVRVVLLNAMGQELRVVYIGLRSPLETAPLTINVNDLASGMYFVRISGARGRATLPLRVY